MKENILSILVELDKWRAERKLTTDSQRAGYIRNIMEELGELASAIKVEQNWETIEALPYKYPLAFVRNEDTPEQLENAHMLPYASALDRKLLKKVYGTDFRTSFNRNEILCYNNK